MTSNIRNTAFTIAISVSSDRLNKYLFCITAGGCSRLDGGSRWKISSDLNLRLKLKGLSTTWDFSRLLSKGFATFLAL